MFKILKELYLEGKINEQHLEKAKKLNWITEEEENLIKSL